MSPERRKIIEYAEMGVCGDMCGDRVHHYSKDLLAEGLIEPSADVLKGIVEPMEQ